jgi:hypothetical protein
VDSENPPTATQLAEMGKKKRQRPLRDLGDRSPKEFAATTALNALAKLPAEKQPSLAAKRGEQVTSDPEASNTGDGTSKVAEPGPKLDPRAWSISSAQQREVFVKAVGRSEIEEAFHAIESGCSLTQGLNTLTQAWIAATESDRRTFYRQLFPANVRNRLQT